MTDYRAQVIATVTSGTRPSGVKDQIVYECDTNQLLRFNGVSWEQYPPIQGATAPHVD